MVTISDIQVSTATVTWTLPNTDIATSQYAVLLNDETIVSIPTGTETTTPRDLQTQP